MTRLLHITGWMALALIALPCVGADSAVLRNGFSIRHERRQVLGTVTRLYTTADSSSFVDIPTSEIDHFEVVPTELAAVPAKESSAARPPAKQIPRNIDRPIDLNEVVKAASGNYHLDPDLVNSVIRAESGFNVRAVSPKGAQGLMQLMPGTASQLGIQNILDPEANVDGGTRYLRELLERYNFDLIKALAAYNAGPQRVEQYGGVPPYYETKAYVARIVRDYNKKIAAKKAVEAGAKKSSAHKSTTGSAANSPTSSKQTLARSASAPARE